MPLMQSLYNTSKSKLGFKPDVKIYITKDSKNMENPLGKTAYYSPQEQKIVLYTQGRHIKDILRSLSHELVHHHQNCRGDFGGDYTTNEGYAQDDEHLREMEREAYECGNMIFRDWEDNLKSKGGKPLFTSTSQYVPPPTSDVAGIYIREGENKKMKLNESTLRDIIRGVIQEMFNDDMVEGIDSSEDNAAQESARAAEEDAEKARIQPIDEENTEELTEEVEEIEEGKHGGKKGDDSKTHKGEKDDTTKKDDELKDDEGGRGEKKGDKADVNEAETFFPKNESIRTKARFELNEALTKKWAKIIK